MGFQDPKPRPKPRRAGTGPPSQCCCAGSARSDGGGPGTMTGDLYGEAWGFFEDFMGVEWERNLIVWDFLVEFYGI